MTQPILSSDIEVMSEIGLTPNEAKIYNALLDLKKASIGDIATHAGVHRRNAYDAIQRLMNKGLAFQVLPKKFLTYAPVHPDKLRELVEEKVSLLETSLPGLVRRFDRVSATQSISVYKGIGGLKNYINLELSVGENIFGLGSKGSWFDTRIKRFATQAAKKYAEHKIQSRIIYDATVKNYPDIVKEIGGKGKYLPLKYSSESSIDIFGEYIAIYSGVKVGALDEDITIFILKDKTLAQDYRLWWQFVWDHLPTAR